MYKLFRYFLALTRLQAKPSEVPYSWALLTVMIVLNIAIETSVVLTDLPLPSTTLIAMNVMSCVFILSSFLGLLLFKSLKARWVQMSTAWLGVNALLGSVTLVLTLITLLFNAMKVNAFAITASFLELTLAFWLVWATGYILQFSLNVSKLLGITLAMVIFFSSAMMELRIAFKLSPVEMAEIEMKAKQALQAAQSKSKSTSTISRPEQSL